MLTLRTEGAGNRAELRCGWKNANRLREPNHNRLYGSCPSVNIADSKILLLHEITQ